MNANSNTPAVIYPSAEDLDTIGLAADYRVALYLVPAAESEHDRPEVVIHGDVGTLGTPEPAWHGRWARIGSYGAGTQGASVLQALEGLEDQLTAVSDAYLGSEWDGHNHKGRWAEDAADRRQALRGAWDRAKLDELVTAWDASDYYAQGCTSWTELCREHGLDPERGEEVIPELARLEDDRAALDGVILGRIEDALRWVLAERRV